MDLWLIVFGAWTLLNLWTLPAAFVLGIFYAERRK